MTDTRVKRVADIDLGAMSPPSLKQLKSDIEVQLSDHGPNVGHIPALSAEWLSNYGVQEERDEDGNATLDARFSSISNIKESGICNDDTSDDTSVLDDIMLDDKDIEALMKKSKPSGFGDRVTATTVVDSDVRLAHEVVDDPLIMVVKKATTHVIENLSKEVFGVTNVIVKPKKINIYQEHGHFAPHVDTPVVDPTYLGTAVVEVPTTRGRNKKVSSGSLLLKTGEKTWINAEDIHVFVPYLTHRVSEVFGGDIRVSVTFEIFEDTKAITDGMGVESVEELEPQSVYIAKMIREGLMIQAGKVPRDETIGIICSNKYSSEQQPYGLDACFKVAAAKFGLKCEFKKIFIDFSSTQDYDNCNPTIDAKVYSHEIEDGDTKFFLPFHSSSLLLLSREYDEGAEHTGNESRASSEEMTYYTSAFLLSLI
jgi:hypothetical protein